jgi:hypothetical protein
MLQGRRLYLYSSWDCLYCLNLNDGYLHWGHHTGSAPAGSVPSPAVDETMLFMAPSGWKLLAFALTDRERRWNFSSGGRVLFGPCVAGEQLYVGTEAGVLHALDKASGQAIWEHRAAAAFRTSPLFGDGYLYAGLADGQVLSWA